MGVSDQFDDLSFRPQYYLTVGQLDIPTLAEPRTEATQLFFNLFNRESRTGVSLRPQVTTSTGEIAAGHRTDGRAAPGILPSEELIRSAQVFRERRPETLQEVVCFGGGGETKGVEE